jgi:hypothetical protein
MFQLVKRATALWLHTNNFNRKGFKWSPAWNLTDFYSNWKTAGQAKVKKAHSRLIKKRSGKMQN